MNDDRAHDRTSRAGWATARIPLAPDRADPHRHPTSAGRDMAVIKAASAARGRILVKKKIKKTADPMGTLGGYVKDIVQTLLKKNKRIFSTLWGKPL